MLSFYANSIAAIFLSAFAKYAQNQIHLPVAQFRIIFENGYKPSCDGVDKHHRPCRYVPQLLSCEFQTLFPSIQIPRLFL